MEGKNNNRLRRETWRTAVLIAAAAFMTFPATALADKTIVLLDKEAEGGNADAPDEKFKVDREQYLCKLSFRKGTEYFQQGRYAEARAEMAWVLSVDPQNELAREIHSKAEAELAKLAAASPAEKAVDEAGRQHRLEMEYRYYQALRLIADGKYEEAVPKLEMAMAIGRNIDNAEKLLADAAALLQKAKEHQNARTSEEAAEARKQAHRAALAYEDTQSRREKQRAQTLFDRAKKYYRLREFEHALGCVKNVLKIDERFPGARYLKNMIERDGKKAIAAGVARMKKLSHDDQIRKTYKDQIFQHEFVVYPDEPRRHVVAGPDLPETEMTGPAIEKIKAALQKKISVEFNGAPLVDAVGYLRKVTGCNNIVVDPRCASKNDPVAGLSVSDREMVHVLSMICRMNGLHWAVKDEIIIISDREIEEEKLLRTYEVAELCVDPSSFPAGRHRSMTVGINPTATEGDGSRAAADEENRKKRDEEGEELAEFVRRTIASDSWGDEGDGGGANTIQYRNGKLVISHNADVHQKIVKLLDDFRRARTVQINILTRFIDINKDYLERAGIDWTGLDNLITRGISGRAQRAAGMPLRSGAGYQGSGRLDAFGIPIPRAPWYQNEEPDTPGSMFGPTRGTPNESSIFPVGETSGRRPWPRVQVPNNRPGGNMDLRGYNVNLNTVQFPSSPDPWTAAGGFFLDVAFLSRYQVRALIEAVQKEKQGNVLTSPRITCFNGQRANIVVATLINYIQTYDDSGTPTIQTVTDGVVLEVKPYVSADQRYVTMELLPSISELRAFEEFLIERVFTTDEWAVYGYIRIQMPDVFTRAVETTVSVPDGGTILIGGMTSATESEGYASVPLLSKIPLIKYLFMNWGRLDRRNSLVILVTANILIQTELEPPIAETD